MIIETTLVPEKLIYVNGDFRIYACSTEDPQIELNQYGNATVKGTVQRLDIGIEYKASIEVAERHPKYGVSYNCISIYQDVPETVEGQRDFFLTLMTDNQVKALYEAYGDVDIIEMIKNNTFDHSKVKGFGPYTYERIKERVLEALEFKEMLSKFGKFGITYETLVKLADEYGSKEIAIQKLEADPYCLCVLDRWGFKRADVVARKMGFVHDHPFRIRSGIKYALEENQMSGHTYMYREDLLRTACDILELTEDIVNSEIEQTEGLKILDDKIALQKTYNAEHFIAKRLKEMLKDNSQLEFDPDEFIGRMEEKYGFKLSDQQREFFHKIKKSRVNLLVGYAGTGKSQVQKFLKELLDELKLRYVFLSPSAKAARVTTSYTGIKAKTIHKAIGYGKNKSERMLISIEEDFIIVDEASMMDIFIGNMLLQKIINPKARILFVGDGFQLPSIQSGNFLHDAVESGEIPTTKLDIVFRQSEGGILDIATMIRRGEQFVPDSFGGKKVFGNNFVLHCVNSAEIEKGYKYYYNSYLKSYDPTNIMVLSPTKKGQIGTVEINKYIQSEVNPEEDGRLEHKYGEVCTFRVGDYVINTKNMYDVLNYDDKGTELVNGDSGVILDIVTGKDGKRKDEDGNLPEREQNGIVVDYDNDVIRMDFSEVSQLLHGWAITTHRSQGSAADAVLAIADKAHKFQLSANLIYTAITRSKERCVLLTQAETLNYAIRKVENMRRCTFMEMLLRTIGKDDVGHGSDLLV